MPMSPNSGESEQDFISRCIAEEMKTAQDQAQASAICYSKWEKSLSLKSQIYMLPVEGVIGEDFKYTDLLMHLNAAKNSTTIKLLINSPGGFVDEAEKMRDALANSGKIILATNTGMVASAVVNIFLTAEKPNRTFNPAKGDFVIHNPFIDPKDGGVTGTAADIEAAAKEMKKLETDLIKKYSKATGTDANILSEFMKENKPLTPQQVQDLGFATIIQPELKAVAYYKSLNTNEMTNEEVVNKITGMESILKKIQSWFRAKSMVVQDVNGKELDFGEAVTDMAQVQPGAKATVDGSPAEGEFTLADGTVLVFAKGELQTITPPAGDELEALKKENAQLKADLEASNVAKAKIETDLVALKANTEGELSKVKTELLAIRNQFSDSKVDLNKTDDPHAKKGILNKEYFDKL